MDLGSSQWFNHVILDAGTTVDMPITHARYLRVTLTAGIGSWWSIGELRVFE